QHYSPYKVVEDFPPLSSLAPGRVELGVGKAAGGFHLSREALRYGGAGTDMDFSGRSTTRHHFIHDTLPEDNELYGAEVLPKPEVRGRVIQLGASSDRAKIAG